MDLNGKTVLLTGASKGLGRALAIGLDAQGSRLLLVARDAGKLESLLNVLHTHGSRPFPCDLSDKDARIRVIQQQRSQLVIPGWYGVLLKLIRLFAPLTRTTVHFSHRRFLNSGTEM